LGGRNNRVFAVTSADGRKNVVKAYFHDAVGQCDRLTTEYTFLTAADRLGIACVPKPLARDDQHCLGLYSFIDGTPVTATDVTGDAVAQVLDFVTRLNDRKRINDLPVFGDASDVSWSAAKTMSRIDARLAHIRDNLGPAPLERDAFRFLSEALMPAWARTRATATTALERIGMRAEARVPPELRLLSPADLGFQNALLQPDGRFVFLDFEYAGWDDPAKFVSDTFHQFAIPIPGQFYPGFRDTIAAWYARPDVERQRYDIMMPVHGIKWVAIILNEFVPALKRRRAFADAGDVSEERRALQLAKARLKLAAVADWSP
jgi:hypothetical protein